MKLVINGESLELAHYEAFHRRRIDRTLDLVVRLGGGGVVELGGHPWVMTGRLLAEPAVRLLATVSAEEVTAWPDEIPLVRSDQELVLPDGSAHRFINHSANLERSSFELDMRPDLVLACEIIEHLSRAPHRMLLNVNAWLPVGGLVVITTPNGAQFDNPLRVKPKMPAYRASIYERHNYVFTMDGLVDLADVCGFEAVDRQFWSPYARRGLARLYRPLSALGGAYARNKFAQTLCLVARKREDRRAAIRVPKVYAPGPWELIDNGDGSGQTERRR